MVELFIRVWLPPLMALAVLSQDPVATLASARAALDSGDSVTAERLYRELLNAAPELEDAHLGLAEALVRQGRRREAALVAARLAQSLLGVERSADAVQVLQRAVDIDPDLAVAHALLGAALAREQRYTDAVATLRRAVDLGERSAQTWLLLAGAQWESSDLTGAAETYEQAIEAGGGAVAQQQLGGLLLWQGRYGDAVAPLVAAQKAGPPPPDLLYDLGRALEGAGRTDEALAAYAQAAEQAPRFAQARYAYALLLARVGRRDEARSQMQAWQQLYEEEQEQLHATKLQQARLDRGWNLLEAGMWPQAAAQFRELPETVAALEGLAAALAAGGDHAGAVSALERAVNMAPERRDLQARLAQARIAAGSR